jgi:dipeptidyl-peptidase-4
MRRAAFFSLLALAASGLAQQRLGSMVDLAALQAARAKVNAAIKAPSWRGQWVDAETLTWQEGNAWKTLNVRSGQEGVGEAPQPGSGGRRTPPRGRQLQEVTSSDGVWTARHENGSVVLSGQNSRRTIFAGDPAGRIKYGTASWVYGEELGQNDAMGFAPDSRRLWAYRFDESKVPDYHVVLDHAKQQSRLMLEAYPKPGQPNPEVSLMIYHLSPARTVEVKVRPSAFDDGVGHYVYGIQWSPDGSRLLFYRTDRRQKVLEFCAADPNTGAVSVLDREEFAPAWVENSMPITFLDDAEDIAQAPELRGKAIWLSERSGFINAYLLDLNKGGVTPITRHSADIRSVLKVDLKRKEMWYTAADGLTPARHQIHRIRLDGTGHARLTDPALRHSAWVSPDSGMAVIQSEAIDAPPVIHVIDRDGKPVRELEKGDDSGLAEAGARRRERFTFTSPDGKTPLSGVISFPVGFSPTKRYPVLLSVYGGPLGPMADSFSERYSAPSGLADYGFLVVSLENRGQGGRGRAFKTALYQQMGRIEIDDQAAGIRALAGRPYADLSRVGVFGTSYGGYASLMAILRHPETFHAAAASSCVSAWENYDTIYTERYMGLLPESAEAYKAGSTLTYADQLKGWLMVYYGTADDNTHPSNSLQIIRELQAKRKSFEVQVGVDRGHSGVDTQRMMEFFIERLGAPSVQ